MSCPAREKFEIGWICALPVEVAAAKEMLDEYFGPLEEQDLMDTNTYILGRIGKHNIVIASQLARHHGNDTATTVAVNMMRTFSKSLRIALMVGVAGGIPSDTHDIRLGDIVVSQPDGTCGGVIQYDMGKLDGMHGKLTRTGSLNSPPKSLLTAVRHMQAAELTDDPQYHGYIQKAIQRTSRTRRTFSPPDPSTDRLFEAKHQHPAGAPTCIGCAKEWEKQRKPRAESGPQVSYGVVASGTDAMKHAATRDHLQKETGALCFEMEAARLMLGFPCIVIRGICDYADSHTNDAWLGYAALASASYTKELLSYVPVSQVSGEDLVRDTCLSMVDGLENINHRLEKALVQQQNYHYQTMERARTKEELKCHRVFKTSTYEQYKNINPDRMEGTCRWVLRSSQYTDWVESHRDNDTLWISADPGCGKSVLAKSLIDIDLQKTAKVCYFFFKDNEEQNDLATALCAILHQLFLGQPSLLNHALPSWRKNGDRLAREVDELWRILMAALSDPSLLNTVIVFDALDESRPSHQEYLITKLQSVCSKASTSSRKGWAKFLITSRPYDEIWQGFQPLIKLFPHSHIEGERKNHDISQEICLVVKLRVAELAERLTLSPRTRDRLEQELLGMENRTYIWLHLVLDEIRTTLQNSLQPDEEVIRLIPLSVHEAYEELLDRVPNHKRGEVKTILKIIVIARRPLTLEEMARALSVYKAIISPATTGTDLSPKGLGERIRNLCKLFVFVRDSKIYLIHQTAREFLIARPTDRSLNDGWSFKLTEAEDIMARICLRCLLLKDLKYQSLSDCEARPLVAYAAEHWADHVRNISASTESELEDEQDTTLEIVLAQNAAWLRLFWRPTIPRLVKHKDVQLDGPDDEGQIASYWASHKGHLEMVKKFTKPLDVDTQVHGSLDIARLSQQNGTHLTAAGEQYGYSLHTAVGNSHLDTEKSVDKGEDVNGAGKWHGYPLEATTGGGSFQIAMLLLQNGGDINARGGLEGTAIQAAEDSAYLNAVKLLLKSVADMDISGHYASALEAASVKGHDDIVRNGGIKINVTKGQSHALITDQQETESQRDESPCYSILKSYVNFQQV